MFHDLPQPQMPWTKLAMISLPHGVWTTSGWNCRPKNFFVRFSITANSEFSVVATVLKPAGIFVSLSPWEFQTCSDFGSFANNLQEPSFTVSVPLPYSRFRPFSTLPPLNCASSCTPKQMPSVGTPRSKMFLSGKGAFGAYTLDGPPDRMMPLGCIAAISAAGVLNGMMME